ncbi:hypothetical protein [Streptomyces lydicus]|uniref:hypothetical protein n=1 Tax=Streptomyces lydicus TaxID=47763 RepID=UPI0037D415FD
MVLTASTLLMAATAGPTMALWVLVLATWLCTLGAMVTATAVSETVLAHAPTGETGAVASVQQAFGMTGYALGPTVYLLLFNFFFHRRWLADAKARGTSLSRAAEAVDTTRSAMAHSPGAVGYDLHLLRQASGLTLDLDFTDGLRLTMLAVSLLPLVMALAALLLLPRRRRTAP